MIDVDSMKENQRNKELVEFMQKELGGFRDTSHILQWKEDAEKYKQLFESVKRDRDSLMPDLEIVEGLKNLLNGISHDSLVSSSSLRKILEGKK